MSIYLNITTVLCLLLSCHQRTATDTVPNKSYLLQYWVNSHEEDDAKQNYKAYHPSSFHFPPSRGREKLEIRENGILISHPIGPLDLNDTIQQTWTLNGDELTIKGNGKTNKYKIILLTKEKLLLQLLP